MTISLPVSVVVSVTRSLMLPAASLTFSCRVSTLVVTAPSAFCAVVVAVCVTEDMTVSVLDFVPVLLPEELEGLVTMELPPLAAAASA